MGLVAFGGCAALVLATLFRPQGSTGYAKGVTLAAVLLGAWVVGNTLVTDYRSYPESFATRIAATYADTLSALSPERALVVVEGGSMTARGVDGKTLEEKLTALVGPTTVVQLSSAGANHIERLFAVRALINGFLHREALEHPRTLLLRELDPGYDREPLALLKGNFWSYRSLSYLNGPTGVYGIWSSLRETYPGGIDFSNRRWRDYLVVNGMALAHLLCNGLKVNWLARHTAAGLLGGPVDYSQTSGYEPLDTTAPGFTFSPQAYAELLKVAINRDPAAFGDPWRSSWAEELDRKWLELLPGATLVYHAPPNLNSSFYTYAYRNCSGASARCILPSEPLMSSLGRAELWYDGAHLRSAGSALYTDWLARQIAGLLDAESR